MVSCIVIDCGAEGQCMMQGFAHVHAMICTGKYRLIKQYVALMACSACTLEFIL